MEKLSPEEILPFDLYFSTLVSMHEHPGYTKAGMYKPSLAEDAKTALEMVQERRKFLPTVMEPSYGN